MPTTKTAASKPAKTRTTKRTKATKPATTEVPTTEVVADVPAPEAVEAAAEVPQNEPVAKGKPVNLPMTADEREVFEAACKDAGINGSHMLRIAVRRVVDMPPTKDEIEATKKTRGRKKSRRKQIEDALSIPGLPEAVRKGLEQELAGLDA